MAEEGERRVGDRFAGKVVLITGAGDGMGRTAALRFAAEGAKVVGCDINAETAEVTVKAVEEAGGTMKSLYPLDLSVPEDAERFVAHAVEEFGGIDVLYNNAAGHRLGTPDEVPPEDFEFTLANVLTAQWLPTRYAIPHLRARGGGSIICIASSMGLPVSSGFPGNLSYLFPYSVAKAGVIRMSVLLANHLATDGIRCNCICPGPTLTPVSMAIFGEDGSDLRRLTLDHMLLGRAGQPEDIVNAVTFLASPEASFITGATLPVDGGWAASGGLGTPDPQAAALVDPIVKDWLSYG